MLSAIAAPGCAFTNLVVRSAPPTAVYRWNFTTSRYLGLPDLLDTFAGVVWPIEGADVDGVALASEATAGQARLAAADGEADSARAVLAAAVAAGDAVEVTPLVAAARSAMDFAGAESESVYDLLVGALGTPWRPTPPIVEMSAVASGQDVVALLVDLRSRSLGAHSRFAARARRHGPQRPRPGQERRRCPRGPRAGWCETIRRGHVGAGAISATRRRRRARGLASRRQHGTRGREAGVLGRAELSGLGDRERSPRKRRRRPFSS